MEHREARRLSIRARADLLVVPCFAALVALAPAGCGDDGSESTDSSVTTAQTTQPSASTTDPAAGTSDGTGEASTSSTSTGDETGDPGTTSSSSSSTTDATTGEPLACEFAPGCHQPSAPAAGVGLATHIPIGCAGDGGFTKSWSVFVQGDGYASAEAPRTIPYLGDFDDDGALDLFVNFRKASTAFVFTGLGDGSFNPTPAQLSGGLFSGGWGGDLGDLNGDGNLDVLVGDHVRGAWAWAGNGAFQFSDMTTGLPAPFLFNGGGLADLDGDGDLDAVFGADQFNKGYALAHNDGGGLWTPGAAPTTVNAGSVGSFSFADFDDDGDLDIFAFGHGGGTIMDAYVYRNDGDGFAEVLSADPRPERGDGGSGPGLDRRHQLRRPDRHPRGWNGAAGERRLVVDDDLDRRREDRSPRGHERRRLPRRDHAGRERRPGALPRRRHRDGLDTADGVGLAGRELSSGRGDGARVRGRGRGCRRLRQHGYCARRRVWS